MKTYRLLFAWILLFSSFYVHSQNTASGAFVNPSGTDLLPSNYDDQPVQFFNCDVDPIFDGSSSAGYDSYHLQVVPFDLATWTSGLPLFQGWVCTSSCVIPSAIDVKALVAPAQLQCDQVYMFSLATGPIWSSVDVFFSLNCDDTYDPSTKTFSAKIDWRDWDPTFPDAREYSYSAYEDTLTNAVEVSAFTNSFSGPSNYNMLYTKIDATGSSLTEQRVQSDGEDVRIHHNNPAALPCISLANATISTGYAIGDSQDLIINIDDPATGFNHYRERFGEWKDSNDVGNAIIQDSQGDMVAVGYTETGGYKNVYVVGVDACLGTKWTKQFNFDEQTEARAVCELPEYHDTFSGLVYPGPFYAITGKKGNDVLFMVIDAGTGNLIFSSDHSIDLNSGNNDIGEDILYDQNGDIVITGTTVETTLSPPPFSIANDKYNPFVLKIDNSLEYPDGFWLYNSRIFEIANSADECSYSIDQFDNGDYAITGWAKASYGGLVVLPFSGLQASEAHLTRISEDLGTVVNSNFYSSGNLVTVGRRVDVTQDGGMLLSGYCEQDFYSPVDDIGIDAAIYIVKTDGDGLLENCNCFDEGEAESLPIPAEMIFQDVIAIDLLDPDTGFEVLYDGPTLKANHCDQYCPEPYTPCLQYETISVDCDSLNPNLFHFNFFVTNPAANNEKYSRIEWSSISPTGLPLAPGIMPLLPDLYPGNTQGAYTLDIYATGPFPQTILLDAAAYGCDTLTGDSACCHIPIELTLPRCCDPCENPWLNVDDLGNSGGLCCYNLDIDNSCEDALSKIRVSTLNPGVDLVNLGTIAGWSHNPTSGPASSVEWIYNSGFAPVGNHLDVAQFCIDNQSGIPLFGITVEYIYTDPITGVDEVLCEESYELECDPGCLEVTHEVRCLDDGSYVIDFCVTNISPTFVANELDITVYNATPANMTLAQTNFTLVPNPFNQGDTYCTTVAVTSVGNPTPQAGDTFSLKFVLKDVQGNDIDCCPNDVVLDIVLPICDPECCLDPADFFGNVLPATTINQTGNTVSVDNPLVTNCHFVAIDWGDGNSIGAVPANAFPLVHSYSGSGPYNMCVLLYEGTDIDSPCWQEELCETFEFEEECCQDEQSFMNTIAPATTVTLVGNTITVNNSLLSDCHQVTLVWSTGIPATVVSGTQLPQSYTYPAGPGFYDFCVIIEEINPLDGSTCFFWLDCENYLFEDADCCQDQPYFYNVVAPATAIFTNGSSGVLDNVEATDCHFIDIDWGDGSTSTGISGANLPVSHPYASSGAYTICWTIEEGDGNGVTCFSLSDCSDIMIANVNGFVTEWSPIPAVKSQESTDDSVSQATIKVYPVPTKADLTIVSDTGAVLVEIVLRDMHGRMVLRSNPSAATTTLRLNHLEAGMYLLEVEDEFGNSTQHKIVRE